MVAVWGACLLSAAFIRTAVVGLELPKVYLQFGDLNDLAHSACLVRDAGFTRQFVNLVPCGAIPLSDVLSAAWIFYPDGTLRGTNGMCLVVTTAYNDSPGDPF